MAWDDLSLQRRRALRRALEAVAELDRRPPETVMLHPLDTLARFEHATAAELGLSSASKANYVSSIRYALRRLGFLAPARRTTAVSDPVWTALLDALPAGPDFTRLRPFLAWCAEQGLTPAAVTQPTLEAYADHRLATRGGGRQPDHSKRVADLWNRAGREVPGWPAQALLEFLLEGDSLRLLRDYLDHYRPLLTHAAGVWLFPGHASAAAPRNKNSFGRAITDAVHQHVGVRMNPHAFRCFVGAMILEANPHAVDDVRAILGHAGFETAMKYYRRFETRGAAQRLSQTIAQQRRAGPVAPPTSPAQRRRKVRP